MAGIFNLFGGTAHAPKQQSLFDSNDSSIMSTIKPTTFGNVGAMAGKNPVLTPAKPRGLSMRSKSELNVVRSNGNGEKSPRKKSPNKALAKVYLGPSECISKPVSPRGKDKCSKMQTIRCKQLKAASSRTFKDLPNEKKQSEENIFKKPLAPPPPSRRAVDAQPEPEKLAYYYDEKKAFECIIDDVDREFVNFMRISKAPIRPYEDEGFASDPEEISEPTMSIPNNIVDVPLDVSPPQDESIDLPALSDGDDDFLD